MPLNVITLSCTTSISSPEPAFLLPVSLDKGNEGSGDEIGTTYVN